MSGDYSRGFNGVLRIPPDATKYTLCTSNKLDCNGTITATIQSLQYDKLMLYVNSNHIKQLSHVREQVKTSSCACDDVKLLNDFYYYINETVYIFTNGKRNLL